MMEQEHNLDTQVYLEPVPSTNPAYGDYRAENVAKVDKMPIGPLVIDSFYLTPMTSSINIPSSKKEKGESKKKRKCGWPLKLVISGIALLLLGALVLMIFALINPQFLVPSESDESPESQRLRGEKKYHVNGAWGHWSSWLECSRSCGGGHRRRIRYCDSPAPSYHGEKCNGTHEQTERCSLHACPVDAVVTEWSEWSETCSSKCARGETQTRHRSCLSQPEHGGQPCPPLIDTRNCTIDQQHCPVDGGWGEWSEWPSCTSVLPYCSREEVPVTRARLCNEPSPKNGGLHCIGNLTEMKICKLDTSGCPSSGDSQTDQEHDSGSGSGNDNDDSE